MSKLTLPRFYRWGGGILPHTWSFGWVTGKDDDLVCVKPSVEIEPEDELFLSPVCSNRFLAFWAFVMKAILARIDHNSRGLEGYLVAIPTEDFAVGEHIAASTTFVVGFPFAPTFSAPILPYQLLVTSNIRMAMCPSSALTSSVCSSPRLFNDPLRECHIVSPPFRCIMLPDYASVNSSARRGTV